MPDLKRLSKFLALLLRHKADEFGLLLDEEGFTDIDTVWKLVNRNFPGTYSDKDLLAVVKGDEHGKKRYEIREGRIWAMFGHGNVTPVSYPLAEPPDILFHGTTPAALAPIRSQGLLARGRQYVHLGTNSERALRVAARYTSQPVLLIVRARQAYLNGVAFFHPEPEHFLARAISPQHIEFPEGIKF